MSLNDAAPPSQTPDFLQGGGEMGALIRAHDWSASPLGCPQQWPDALRSALLICLNTPVVSAVHWGPDLLTLYNDPYAPALAERHPWALGRPMNEVWSEIWDVLGPQIASVMATARGFSTDRQQLRMRREGRVEDTYWVYSFAPLYDGGAVVGIFVTALDTTAQVLAEQRGAADTKRMARMFEQAPGFIAQLEGPEHRIALANAAFRRLVGDRDVVGKTIAEALPDAVEQGYLSLLDQVFASGETFTSSRARYAVQATPDGVVDERYVDFVFQPIADDKGEVTGIFVEGQDITEAERAAAVLRESEARFRDMADKAPVMMWVTDPSGYCTHLNARWYEFTGQEPGAGEAYGWLDAVHPEDRPGAEAAFVAANAERCDYRVDFRLRRADGVYRWTIDAAAARFGENGEYLGYVGSVIDIDERREAEQTLALSQEQLRLATDVGEIGEWDVDNLTGDMFWPPRVKAMFGISPDVPVTLEDFHNGVHPEDREKTRAAYEAASDPELRAFYDVEYRTIGKEDGVVRWVAAKGRGLFDASGVCYRVIGTAIDVTARKADEEQLRALNADLERQVTERTLSRGRTWQLSPEIMGVLNAGGYFEQSNPAWASVLGWSAAEIARTIFFDFIHPDDLAKTQAQWDAAMARGEPALRFENRYRTKDGHWRWLSWVAVPEDGKVYCSARDITAEKAQEAALAERTAERDRIWHLSTDLMLVAGFDGTINSVNPAWRSLLGWSDAELIGTSFLTLVHSEDQDSTIGEMDKLDQGITTFRFENRYRASDGGYHWISWTAVPDAQLIHAIGRDITAEKEAAASLEATQEALRQSQKMEAMGQLTGGVAHDFNNLLTPIVGSLDMLQRKGVGNEREQRLIAGAMQSADRAKTLVQRLLAFARRQPLQASAVDIGGLVTGMAELVASTSGPQVKVVVDAAEKLPPAKADPNQLEMALLNLGVNARDAMPDGGTLRITADCESVGPGHRSGLRPGDYVRLSVADTGVGMDEATMKRAVEPFFSTKGVGKGTGLGLSMAHGLASQLGGALTIQSRPGVGTNVELWLPLSGASVELPKVPAVALPGEAARGTALLVDDEELVRMSTADMLADMGFAVVEAASAEEALRLLHGGLSADLLVTDHLMPGMNGTDLARTLRSANPRIRVLIVSGYAETEGVDIDLPRLTKPFRNADLAAKLLELEAED